MVDVSIGEDGPGPSTTSHRQRPMERVLDKDDDSWVKEEYTANGAGKCIHMDTNLHDRWKQHFSCSSATEVSSNQDNPYAPFASELDWRIACWVVKDGIGHKSFDRFLSIPGVCFYIVKNPYNWIRYYRFVKSLDSPTTIYVASIKSSTIKFQTEQGLGQPCSLNFLICLASYTLFATGMC